MKHKILLAIQLFFIGQISATVQPSLAQVKDYAAKVSWAFEENKGQVTGADSSKVKYFYKQNYLTMFLLNKGIAYQFEKLHYPEGYKQERKDRHSSDHLQTLDSLNRLIRRETYRMDIELIGANQNCEIITEGKSTDYIQYYNHNALDVHAYQKITYKNIYPNIDWVIYQSKEESIKSKEGDDFKPSTLNFKLIKYDFIVYPGGDPSLIKLKTHWTENTNLNTDGSLSLTCSMGTVTEQAPISYQEGKEIKTQFSLSDSTIQFDIANYDKSKTLIIDPFVRIWGTYYGGDWSEESYSTKIDKWGNVYIGGITSSTNLAFGGHQNTLSSSGNGFLVKFNSCGERLWATYYGGEVGTSGRSISVDRSGNVYLCGETVSTSNISFNGHQNSLAGWKNDAFLVKFNPSGIRLWATYYGGTNLEEFPSVCTDYLNNVYLVGNTYSKTQIAHNGFKDTLNNYFAFNVSEAFLVKFDSTGVRQWATYYGGNFGAGGSDCAVDNNGNVYLIGSTQSNSLITFNGFQNIKGNNNAQEDAYLVKFDKDGARQWATYYGGDSADYASSVKVDKLGDVYIAGNTNSSNFSTFNGHQSTIGGKYDAFLVKFNTNGNRLWASLYGGNNNDYGIDLDLDKEGNIYLAGLTSSTNSIAFNGYQNNLGGKADAFAVKFDKNGARLWGTYYGGTGEEGHASIAIDTSGALYIGGTTDSSTNLGYNGFKNSFTISFSEEAFLVKLYHSPTSLTPTITIQSPNGDFACEGKQKFFTATTTNAGSKPKYSWTRNSQMVGNDTNVLEFAFMNHNDTIQCRMISNLLCFVYDTVWSNKIIVKVKNADTFHMYDTMCELQTYWFNNENVSTSGLYLDTFMSSAGCDSFVFLHLHVKDTSYHSFSHITPCAPNASFMFNGLARTQSGVYSARYLNALACDSTAVLNLTIRKPSTPSQFEVRLCPGDSFYFGSVHRKDSGDYPLLLTNSLGCDSLITLRLRPLKKPMPESNTIQACSPFSFLGKTYTSSSIVLDTIKSINGNCDSVFRTNIIQLKPLAIKAPDTNFIVCDSIKLNNRLYTTSFSFIDTFRTVGTVCDSVYRKTNYIIRSTPQIGLKERDTFMRGSQVTLKPFSATNYLWSTGESTKNISFKLTEDRQLYLIAWNEEPCRDTAYISLVAEDLAVVGMPNGFSPTGEHTENRTLRPNINGRLEYFHMMVFNRWGEKVYETFDTQPLGWNGIFKGEPAPAGLYGYVMEYRTLGVIYNKSGEVMLVR